MLSEFGLTPPSDSRLLLFEPIGYHDSLCLTENARLVLTDSGGLQEEATFFRTPCLTLRPNTERPITITLGSNRLTKLEHLMDDVNDALNGPERKGQAPPLWDGRTAERTLRHLLAASSA
jgi:UDP-N-acetylglucosamine 2-epimerase (non-hydrolysing)